MARTEETWEVSRGSPLESDAANHILTVAADRSNNQVEIEYTYSWEPPAGLLPDEVGDIIPGDNTSVFRVELNIGMINISRSKLSSIYENIVTELIDLTVQNTELSQLEGAALTRAESRLRENIRDELTQNISSVVSDFRGLSNTVGLGEVEPNSPVSDTFTTAIPAINIPVPSPLSSSEVESIIQNEFNNIRSKPALDVTLSNANAIFGGTIINEQLELDPELFFSTESADVIPETGTPEIRCESLPRFNNVQRELRLLDSQAEAGLEAVRSIKSEVDSIENSLPIDVSVSVPGTDITSTDTDGSTLADIGPTVTDIGSTASDIVSTDTEREEESSGSIGSFNQFISDGGISVDAPSPQEAQSAFSNSNIGPSEIQNAIDNLETQQDALNNRPQRSVSDLSSELSKLEDTVNAYPDKCQNQLQDLLNGANELISKFSNLMSATEEKIQRLLSLLQNISDRDLQPECPNIPSFNEFKDQIDTLESDFGINPVDFGNLGDIDTTAPDRPSTPQELNDARSRVDDVRDQISQAEADGTLPGNCSSELLTRLANIEDQLGNIDVSRTFDCLQQASQADEILNQVEADLPISFDFDQTSATFNVDGNLQTFDPNRSDLTQADIQSMRGEVDNAENIAKSSLEESSECFSAFNSRISRIRTVLDTVSNNLRSVQPPEDGIVDCASKYNSISSSINSLETDLSNISEPASTRQVSQISGQAGSLLQQVNQDVEEQKCIDQFKNSILTIEDDIQNLNIAARDEDITCAQEFPELIATASDLDDRARRLRFDKVDRLRKKARRPDVVLPGTSLEELRQAFLEDFQELQDDKGNFTNAIHNTIGINDPNNCKDFFFDLNGDISNTLDPVGQLLRNVGKVPDVPCANVSESLTDDVQTYEGTTRGWLNQSPEQRQEEERDQLIKDGENLIDRIENEVQDDDDCRLELVARVRSQVTSLRNTSGRQEPSCTAISLGIRNSVDDYEDRADQFLSKNPVERTRQKRDELINDGEQLRNTINNNVDDNNTCKSRLRNRVNDKLESVRSTTARPETSLPCNQRFERATKRVETFEDRVLNLTAPVTPQQVQEIARSGEDVITVIRNEVPTDDPCNRELIMRTRRLIDRAQSLTTQVRIEEAEEGDTQREQLLQDALQSLEQINTGETSEADF